MKMRHEYKHIIGYADRVILQSKLDKILKTDVHADAHGEYRVRSLYFDDLFDTALKDKVNGVNRREKFRIRYYDDDTEYIKLERKIKLNGMCNKTSKRITKSQVESIIAGDIDFLLESSSPLFHQLYSKMNGRLLRPKVIVDYMRRPYVYDAGNVRITIDYNIRTSISSVDFFSTDIDSLPASDEDVLEVKYDEFLPDFIRRLVQMDRRPTMAFSKYAAARRYD